jgi:hypothetical protein
MNARAIAAGYPAIYMIVCLLPVTLASLDGAPGTFVAAFGAVAIAACLFVLIFWDKVDFEEDVPDVMPTWARIALIAVVIPATAYGLVLMFSDLLGVGDVPQPGWSWLPAGAAFVACVLYAVVATYRAGNVLKASAAAPSETATPSA